MSVETVASVDGIELEATVRETDGGAARGVVVFAHGLGSSMDANKFGQLADRLAESGYHSVRFSFRGHGGSAGTRRGMTIAGELLDFEAIAAFATQRLRGPLYVVAASFGSVATCLSLPWLGDRLAKLVLWYPVLDLRRTFLSPETPTGMQLFGPQQRKVLNTKGMLLLKLPPEFGTPTTSPSKTSQPAPDIGTWRQPQLPSYQPRSWTPRVRTGHAWRGVKLLISTCRRCTARLMDWSGPLGV